MLPDLCRFILNQRDLIGILYATDRTEQTEIQGELIIEDKNFDERVSDHLNDSRSFLPMLNVEIYATGKLVAKHDFFCINKQFIAYVIED